MAVVNQRVDHHTHYNHTTLVLHNTEVQSWPQLRNGGGGFVFHLTEVFSEIRNQTLQGIPCSSASFINITHGLKSSTMLLQHFQPLKCHFYQQTCEQRQVSHFQYLSWPDYGVPTSAVTLIDFLGAVKRQQRKMVNTLGPQWTGHPQGPPMVVHCSAGIGRTGETLTR